MGCDIHVYVEKKIDDEWVYVWSPTYYSYTVDNEERRNYRRFSELAGVRRDMKSVYREPLGLPDDASGGVIYHAKEWGPDGHSHSYMGMKEAKEVWKKTSHEPKKFYPFESLCNDEYGDDLDDYRVVFWFDN